MRRRKKQICALIIFTWFLSCLLLLPIEAMKAIVHRIKPIFHNVSWSKDFFYQKPVSQCCCWKSQWGCLNCLLEWESGKESCSRSKREGEEGGEALLLQLLSHSSATAPLITSSQFWPLRSMRKEEGGEALPSTSPPPHPPPSTSPSRSKRLEGGEAPLLQLLLFQLYRSSATASLVASSQF